MENFQSSSSPPAPGCSEPTIQGTKLFPIFVGGGVLTTPLFWVSLFIVGAACGRPPPGSLCCFLCLRFCRARRPGAPFFPFSRGYFADGQGPLSPFLCRGGPMWPPATLRFSLLSLFVFLYSATTRCAVILLFTGIFRRPGGEFLFGRPKRNQKGARGCVQSAVRQGLPPPCHTSLPPLSLRDISP